MSKEIIISEKDILEAQKRQKIVQIKPIDYVSPLNFEEVERIKPVPLKNILHPILPEQGLMMVYAPAGLGKTFFTLNLAYAIAAGGRFLKYSAPLPKSILYIDAEMKYGFLHERLMRIKQQQGILDFPKNFIIYTPDQLVSQKSKKLIRMPKICKPEGQMFYDMAIEENNIDVVFLDNLSLLSEIDLDKANEWHLIQDWLLLLKAAGKSVVMVHHAGKNEKYRGTSRMIDAMDTVIALQSVKEESEDFLSKKFKIVYEKNRSFYGIDALPYEAAFQNDLWSHRSIQQSNLDIVIECLNAKMLQKEIAQHLNVSQPTVCRLIKQAKASGRLIES